VLSVVLSPRTLLVAALFLAACGNSVPAGRPPAERGAVGSGGQGAGTGGAGAAGTASAGGAAAGGASGAGGAAMGQEAGVGVLDAPTDTADTVVKGDADATAAPADGPESAGAMQLQSAGFFPQGGDLIFPASACYPKDQSPPFSFVGVPAAARSLAFTFVDRSNGATKWVIWDIPPGTSALPANLSKSAHPTEMPAATQRGSLGRTGYSGPGVSGPPLHTYDFRLYALDVDKLPGTEGASTITIRTVLIPQHLVAQSPIFTAKGQLGGSGQ
jgi:Raf kinase inhibitor-like YbhB/YbcL family protein